jgi:hypothetical protein
VRTVVWANSCEGACQGEGLCGGRVRKVTVRNPETGYYWGEFWYCDTAIEIDRTHGLTVTEGHDG